MLQFFPYILHLTYILLNRKIALFHHLHKFLINIIESKRHIAFFIKTISKISLCLTKKVSAKNLITVLHFQIFSRNVRWSPLLSFCFGFQTSRDQGFRFRYYGIKSLGLHVVSACSHSEFTRLIPTIGIDGGSTEILTFFWNHNWN